MKAFARPRDLDPAELRRVWKAVDRRRPLGERIESVARAFLGRPYVDDPLEGSAQSPEIYVASLAGFDCVTYVETVLAMALAPSSALFGDLLRRIRYAGGRIDWRRRNHYTSDWLRENAKAGFVREIRVGSPPVARRRVLSLLPGYPARRRVVRSVPKRRFWRARALVQTGDLLMFASTRPRLDIFHLGVAVRDGERLWLLNAARSRRRVVRQDLAEFLAQNRMAGVIVVRPVDR
jgi:Protein of unknown function (DUF1460)